MLEYVGKTHIGFVGREGLTVRVLLPRDKCKKLGINEDTIVYVYYDHNKDAVAIKVVGKYPFSKFKQIGIEPPDLPSGLKRIQTATTRFGVKSYAVYIPKDYARWGGLIPEELQAARATPSENDYRPSYNKEVYVFYDNATNTLYIKP